MPWRYIEETLAANPYGPRVWDAYNIVVVVNKVLFVAFAAGSSDALFVLQLATLALQSSNFTFQVIVGDSYGADTRDENGTWQGQTAMLREGYAEIAMPPVSMDHEKLDDISYLNFYDYTDVLILSTKKLEKDVEDVLTPFADCDKRILIILAFAVIIAAVISWLLEKPFDNLKHSTIGNYMELYLAYMLYQGGVCRSTSVSCRVLIIVMAFAGMTIVCLFYADFKSSLIVERETDVINTVEDLLKKKNVYPMMTNAQGMLDRVMQEMNDEDRMLAERFRILYKKHLQQGIINDRGYAEHCYGEKFFESLKNGEVVCIDSRLVIDNCLPEWCKIDPTWTFHISKDPVASMLVGIPRRKTLEPWILQRLEAKISVLTESGLVGRLSSYLDEAQETCLRKRSHFVSEEQETTMKVGGLASAYYFLLFGISVSLLVFLVELLWHRISGNRSLSKTMQKDWKDEIITKTNDQTKRPHGKEQK